MPKSTSLSRRPARHPHPHSAVAYTSAWKVIRVVLTTIFFFLTVALLIGMAGLLNASSEVRRCLEVSRFHVRPNPPDLPVAATKEPVAFGYMFTDSQQSFVRWKLADGFTPAGLEVTGIAIRGPLTADEPDVAPVARRLTPHIQNGKYFVGNATLDSRLLAQVTQNPAAFYVSFEVGLDSERTEVARDYFNKIC